MKQKTMLVLFIFLPIIFGGCGKSDDDNMSHKEAMKRCEPEIKKAVTNALSTGGDVHQATDRATKQCLKKYGIGHTH